jgi:hypothetical protein
MTQTPDITPEAVDALIERLREWWEYDTGHLMVRSGETLRALSARLAEAEFNLDQYDHIFMNLRYDLSAEQARAEAAEAALPAVYRLALEDAAERLLAAVTREYNDHRDYRKAIRALPIPTAAELMARIQTGEKE